MRILAAGFQHLCAPHSTSARSMPVVLESSPPPELSCVSAITTADGRSGGFPLEELGEGPASSPAGARLHRLAAELHDIASDMFRAVAIAQRGGELRHAIGKDRDAAHIADIPLAAMLEGGGHPVGIMAALHHALFVATPEQDARAANGSTVGAGHPAPFARRSLTPAQIGDVGIGVGENAIDDELVFGRIVDGGEITGMTLP
jgi:hypothetical protein